MSFECLEGLLASTLLIDSHECLFLVKSNGYCVVGGGSDFITCVAFTLVNYQLAFIWDILSYLTVTHWKHIQTTQIDSLDIPCITVCDVIRFSSTASFLLIAN